jgi:putative flippase GtrA
MIQRLWARWSWAIKSVGMSGAGSALDYTTVLIADQVFRLATPAATALGLTIGASANFLLNRRFVFKSQGSIVREAFRFALALGGLMSVHAALAWLLRDVIGVPLFFAKALADLSVLAFTMPLVLRRFVFRAQPALAPTSSAPAL